MLIELSSSPTLRVVAWIDPLVDERGHDPRSDYVERYWLGVLGPTATWLLRRLADRLEAEPEGFELDLAMMAAELGVGHRSGRHAPFLRTLARCVRFGIIDAGAHGLRVRRRLPALSAFQAERLPAHLQAELRATSGEARPGPTMHERRERARGFALSLLAQGLDLEGVERGLHGQGVHPALAHEVLRWAAERASTAGSNPAVQPPAA